MIRYCNSLSDLEEKDEQRSGGKAYNLSVLLKKGFTVPKGFVVFSDVLEEFLELNQLNFVGCTQEQIRSATELPQYFDKEIGSQIEVYTFYLQSFTF